MRVVFYGHTGLTVSYDPDAPGEEVSIHGGDEQERMVLSKEGWKDLHRAAGILGSTGIEIAPAAVIA